MQLKKISDMIPGNMPTENIRILCDYFVGDKDASVLNLKEFRNKLLSVIQVKIAILFRKNIKAFLFPHFFSYITGI